MLRTSPTWARWYVTMTARRPWRVSRRNRFQAIRASLA